ncbi:MAG: hypothetical protein AB1690_12200, partial [Candidatus Zixiibacteriota bacterium]
MLENAYLIMFYPLFAFVMIVFFTRWKEKLSSYLSIGMILLGFLHSVLVMVEMLGRHGQLYEKAIPFITLPNFSLELGIYLDPLT